MVHFSNVYFNDENSDQFLLAWCIYVSGGDQYWNSCYILCGKASVFFSFSAFNFLGSRSCPGSTDNHVSILLVDKFHSSKQERLQVNTILIIKPSLLWIGASFPDFTACIFSSWGAGLASALWVLIFASLLHIFFPTEAADFAISIGGLFLSLHQGNINRSFPKGPYSSRCL